MATDKKNETLSTYASDVHALVVHGIQAIHRHAANRGGPIVGVRRRHVLDDGVDETCWIDARTQRVAWI